MLARKGVRIIKELDGPGNDNMRWSFRALANVLRLKNDYGDEAKTLPEII
jgi:hypothetical protein